MGGRLKLSQSSTNPRTMSAVILLFCRCEIGPIPYILFPTPQQIKIEKLGIRNRVVHPKGDMIENPDEREYISVDEMGELCGMRRTVGTLLLLLECVEALSKILPSRSCSILDSSDVLFLSIEASGTVTSHDATIWIDLAVLME